VGLAGEVLALHVAIQDVLIVENRAGQLLLADQAGRNDHSFLEAVNERERDAILVAPGLILGAASQTGNVQKAGELRLVGMLYDNLGILCVPVNNDSYLMATTTNESLLDVMKALQKMLPTMLERRTFAPETLAINSAVQADQTVRAFFAKTRLCEPNSVRMEDATLDSRERFWQVSGSYRATHAVRSKRYYIELDARTGAVTKFQARSQS
jgi:hypothetical protein